MEKDDIETKDFPIEWFVTKAYHKDCGGELRCFEASYIDNLMAGQFNRVDVRASHRCEKCHEIVILDKKYPERYYKIVG